jgi:hypothetical protein
MVDLLKYKRLTELGASPSEIARVASRDGVQPIEQIKLLRELFNLSLVEAKEVYITADGVYASLNEYQATLIPLLETALYIVEWELTTGQEASVISWNEDDIGVALLVRKDEQYSGEWFPFNTDAASAFRNEVQNGNEVQVQFSTESSVMFGVVDDVSSTGNITINVVA